MLRVRWLGRVAYREAWDLQRSLVERSTDEYLLLLEHPHVFTLGVRADPANILVDPDDVGAECVRTDRGGDVTYHGPGQLVGYPILNLPMGHGALPAHVERIETIIIDALAELGILGAGRLPGYPGVWVDPEGARPRKIAAIGVRVSHGRTMHGFALNVSPDLTWFDRIVPCGLVGRPVTSIVAEGGEVSMRRAVDAVTAAAERYLSPGEMVDRQEVLGHGGEVEQLRLGMGMWSARSGPAASLPSGSSGTRVTTLAVAARGNAASGSARRAEPVAYRSRKPAWMRAPLRIGPGYRGVAGLLHGLDLVTVCEEAGCPNIYECWSGGTATFMINGSRCTRACKFCLVDTARPEPLSPDEPRRVGEAVSRMALQHAVVTAVARDDLPDGGAGAFAATIEAIRERCDGVSIEVLIPDFKGNRDALGLVLAAGPDVVNHNIETVARLQRLVRPSAGYARSLSLLAYAAGSGHLTKSGIILGMGESWGEVISTMADLRASGVSLLTIGQYLRPSLAHLPVARWWAPQEFDALSAAGMDMGFSHVQSSPLTRSSYHAREAAMAETRASATV